MKDLSIETQQSSGPGLYSLDNIYGKLWLWFGKSQKMFNYYNRLLILMLELYYSGEKGCLIDKDTKSFW